MLKALVMLTVLVFSAVGPASARSLSATAPGLGVATSFSVLGASTVTNTGVSVVNGDLGVSPGTAVTGFPPGIVIGTTHAADAVAATAQADALTAYLDLAGQGCNFDLTGQDLGGMTLLPGVYCFSSSAQLTGDVTLDGQGNPAAVWVFQIGTTLTTASAAKVLLTNGASACSVYWQIGTSATLGTGTAFAGNILANTSTTLTSGASLVGRAFALNGAVVLDDNAISNAGCTGLPGHSHPEPNEHTDQYSYETPTSTPTNTPVPVALSLNKTAYIAASTGVHPGDWITYALAVRNSSLFTATEVVMTDTLPAVSTYLPGTSSWPVAQPTPGLLVWNLPDLGPGAAFTVTFATLLLTIDTVAVVNTAVVDSAQTEAISATAIVPYQPTAVQLEHFGAEHALSGGARISWATVLEANTLGFVLYRGPDRASATLLTPDLIPATGGGSAYAYDDLAGDAGVGYWLVEIDLAGGRVEYGPVKLAQTQLPAVLALAAPGGVPHDAYGAQALMFDPPQAQEQTRMAGGAQPIALAADVIAGPAPAGSAAVVAPGTQSMDAHSSAVAAPATRWPEWLWLIMLLRSVMLMGMAHIWHRR